MDSLSRILEEATARLQLGEAALEARAVFLWPEIVGPQIAAASEAQSIRSGTLWVVVRSSAWNQELSFQKRTILRRYRERLGRAVVRDVRCVVGTVRGAAVRKEPLRPPEAEVARIRLPDDEVERIGRASSAGDPELAQAVRRALTREAQLRRWHLEHGARACLRCGSVHRTAHRVCPACRVDQAGGEP